MHKLLLSFFTVNRFNPLSGCNSQFPVIPINMLANKVEAGYRKKTFTFILPDILSRTGNWLTFKTCRFLHNSAHQKLWENMNITCLNCTAYIVQSGPGCSQLMMPLVNILLKFQMLIFEIFQYFLLKKCEKLLHCKSFSHFFNKTISVFGNQVVKHLTSWPLNELVKLTMLWTIGPWSGHIVLICQLKYEAYNLWLEISIVKWWSLIFQHSFSNERIATLVYGYAQVA